MVFELCSSSVFDLMASKYKGAIPTQEAKWLFFQTLAGLSHIHNHCIVHRFSFSCFIFYFFFVDKEI
jgi:serine/threonine protein kinase